MKKTQLLLIGLIVPFFFTSCLTSEFLESSSFSAKEKVKDLYVIVVGDKTTNQCLEYYKSYTIDSLKAKSINVDGEYFCCRDKDTDMNQTISQLANKNRTSSNILTIVITKVVVGYGTTSSRELQLDLFDVANKKKVWSGKVRVDMSWFISDQNYRDVALKINKVTIQELTKKGII